MKSKLEKLQSKLEELRRKRFNARKIKEHHAREMKKATAANDIKDFEKHNTKYQFHNGVLENIRAEIQTIKDQIEEETLKLKEEHYQELLKTFDLAMIKRLSVLQDALKVLIERLELKDIISLGNELYDFFVAKNKGFERKDLEPYNMLGMLSIKVRTSHITEEFGEMERITAIRNSQAAAQKRSNVQVWSTHLVGQIQSCLDIVKKRSKASSSIKEKAKKFLFLF